MKHVINALLISLALTFTVAPASAKIGNCAHSQLNLGTQRALKDVGIRNVDVCQLSRVQKVGITLAANSSGSFSEMRQRVKAILR